jgi:hypothetical protein
VETWVARAMATDPRSSSVDRRSNVSLAVQKRVVPSRTASLGRHVPAQSRPRPAPGLAPPASKRPAVCDVSSAPSRGSAESSSGLSCASSGQRLRAAASSSSSTSCKCPSSKTASASPAEAQTPRPITRRAVASGSSNSQRPQPTSSVPATLSSQRHKQTRLPRERRAAGDAAKCATKEDLQSSAADRKRPSRLSESEALLFSDRSAGVGLARSISLNRDALLFRTDSRNVNGKSIGHRSPECVDT